MRIVCGIVILLGLVGTAAAAEAFGQRQRPRPPRPVQPAPESPVEAVKKVIEQFRRAWEAGDSAGLRQVCAADVVVIGSGRRDQGIDAVIESVTVNAKNFPRMEWQLGDISPRVIGQVALAHGETRLLQMTAHGTRLEYVGFVSFALERQRTGWKVALADFNLRPIQATTSEPNRPRTSSLEGAWLLESVRNLTTGHTLSRVAMMLFTPSRFSLVVFAPGRRLPRGKPLADYSKKELLELVRGLEATTGSYQREGNTLHILPTFAFLPEAIGVTLTFENVKLVADRLSYEVTTPDGRLEYVWRRLE
ncbi:MAG TPA: nuclear transport factor 2 family protein [Blastocatellia bacterium]|nr:nuclear transport factor 2 family protein [Blastocatellia bacterium]